jgi:hypothetical protein
MSRTSPRGRHSAPRPPGAARSRTGPRRRSKRALGSLIAAVTAAGVSTIAAPSASASLGSAGPIDPATNFPAYYTDGGLALELCLGLPFCLSDTDLVAVHEAGGDAEAFYWAADATAGAFEVHLALEAAYAADGPNQEVVFQRTQVRMRDGGLPANTVYTVKDPYGTFTCTTNEDGEIDSNGCRIETTPVETEFGRALPGRLGPFLTWDTFGTTGPDAPPAGYIGDNATPHAVVGSPTGFNAVKITGPGLPNACADGTPRCIETDEWIIQGKVADTGRPSASLSAGALDFGNVPATPPVTRSLTYANTGTLPVTLSDVALSGASTSAFGVQNGCPVAPTTVDPGTRCTINVTFTPQPGQSSTATLTVTDGTAASPRTVALNGSNLPRMFVSDPTPPTALAFGNQAVNTSSPENNVVIGNDGVGPLTIPASGITLTGASAGHYRLGANGCTAAVAPDSGCEIGVVFRPTTTGSKTASLRVQDSNGAVVTIPLTGTGAAADIQNPTAPTLSGSLTGTTANLNWTAATDNVGVTGYQVSRGGTQIGTTTATTRTFSDPGRVAGVANSYTVRAIDAAGNVSASSNTVTLTVPAADRAPAAPGIGTAVRGNASATVNWTAPAANGGSAITSYQVQVRTGTTVVRTVTGIAANASSTVVTGLNNGTAYNFQVRAVNAAGPGAFSAASNTVTPATTPGAPVIGTASAGAATGAPINATARWTPPTSTGGSAITGYVVRALRMSSTGTVLSTTTSAVQPASARSLVMTLPVAGNYRFTVQARNAIGNGPQSARSNLVAGR